MNVAAMLMSYPAAMLMSHPAAASGLQQMAHCTADVVHVVSS
jgi:hypothetical protein